ncbi:unnamed protein product [Cylindrotheca closterium]|uniref:Uncharacterized protein n=1 Tax=Cylindrotheca closterium TaxID=2856 RepID=A0AAD2FT99_9STRA|nr:unnamed protein product [Cylindrotheca closterium]
MPTNSHAKRPFSSISSSSPMATTTGSSSSSSSSLHMESSIKQKSNSAFETSRTTTRTKQNSSTTSSLMKNSAKLDATSLPSFAQIQDFVMPVIFTSMLITSNTVGAGMLVLPELVQGPGMGASMGLFFALYLGNLISGLLIAEVAITQKEQSGEDAPSSFKAFSEANLDSELAKDVIAAVCVIKNALVLAFGTMKAGQLGHEVLGWNADLTSMVWVMLFAGVLGTQSAPRLSKVASLFVAGLFSSFASILIPGLAHMETPVMDVLTMPGTSSDPMAAMVTAAPIILMSFIFQNIVPTTARILEYDRTKIALSMGIGTLFPFAMYAAWCMAVLGGGVDTAVGLDGPMFTLFSVVTIAGSHLGSATSMAEELDTYLRPALDDTQDLVEQEDRKNEVFSWASVLITAAMGIGLGEGFAGNLNDLLSLAGAYGSPFLYFVLPLIMMSTQREKLASEAEPKEIISETPFPNIPLGIAASAASAFLGLQALQML